MTTTKENLRSFAKDLLAEVDAGKFERFKADYGLCFNLALWARGKLSNVDFLDVADALDKWLMADYGNCINPFGAYNVNAYENAERVAFLRKIAA